MDQDKKEIYDFYNHGVEIGRLKRGLGIIEFERSKDIISSYLSLYCSNEPAKNITIYDIGGGIGVYSSWLSSIGYTLTLIELAKSATVYALSHMDQNHPYEVICSDAKKLPKHDNLADIVLFMGPYYHLQKKQERLNALHEAYRVLKKGGLFLISGISKYSSTTWALSVYGTQNQFMDDPIFLSMLEEELKSGCHNRPKEYPNLIAKSYFCTIADMQSELEQAGFHILNQHAIEGLVWFTPNLAEKWENPLQKETLKKIIQLTEHDSEVLGMSPHFMLVAKK